jgi:hypothetical protein
LAFWDGEICADCSLRQNLGLELRRKRQGDETVVQMFITVGSRRNICRAAGDRSVGTVSEIERRIKVEGGSGNCCRRILTRRSRVKLVLAASLPSHITCTTL